MPIGQNWWAMFPFKYKRWTFLKQYLKYFGCSFNFS